MIKKSAIALCVFASLTQSPILAKDGDSVTITNGFATGNRWRTLPNQQRMLYVLGVLDGLRFSPVMALGTEDRTNKLANCTQNMNGEQILAIADKYVEARPEKWHESVHFQLFGALTEACRIFK